MLGVHSVHDMTKAGIYTITHIRTGHTYVGQSLNCPKRFAQHERALNHRAHHNDNLQRLWNADGRNLFDFKQVYVLEEELGPLEKQIWLTRKELDYWWHYKTQGKSLNKIPPEICLTNPAAAEYETWKITINKEITESLNEVRRTLAKIKDSSQPLISYLREKRSQLKNVEHIIHRNVGWRRFFFRQRDDPPVEELRKMAARLREQISVIEPTCEQAGNAIRALEARRSKLYRSYPGNIERTLQHADRLPKIERQRMVINFYYGFGIFYENIKAQES